VPSPPAPPEPAWIAPSKLAPPRRKKKAALTPKEALRAKVQARAVRQAPARPASSMSEPTEDALPKAVEPGTRAEPVEALPRAKAPARGSPGLLQRVLSVFRRPKPRTDEDE
jgi:hypothetical protein